MARKGFPGTQPSRMRPMGCIGVGQGKGQKQDERSSVELKGVRVSDGGDMGVGRGGERRQSQAGQPWSLVSLVRASGLHPWARGDPGKQKSLRVRGGGGTGGLRIRRELVGPCTRGRALWGKGRG